MKPRILFSMCFTLILYGLLPLMMSAQGTRDWEELWRNSPPSDPHHPNAWMTPARSFTGLAYDKWRDVVYIVNPNTTVVGPNWWQTPRIYAWNANTGQPALNVGRSADAMNSGKGGELPVPLDTISPIGNPLNRGFSQNTYSIYKIDLDDEGRIYACNLVVPIWGICIPLPTGGCDPVYLGQGPFRVWRWEHPKATPVLAYATLNQAGTAVGDFTSSEMTYTRWGDAFDVIGKRAMYYPENSDPPYMVDSVRIYASGGSYPLQSEWNREVNVILADRRPENQRPNRDVAGGGKLEFRLAIKLVNSISGLASHGVAGTSLDYVHDVWMSSNPRLTTAATHYQHPTDPWPQNYNQLATGNQSLSTNLTGQAGAIKYFELPHYGRKFLVLADGMPTGGINPAIPNDNTTARVLDISTPGAGFVQFDRTPQLGNKTLNNNSAERNYIADVDFKLQFYTPEEDPDEPGLHLIVFVLMSNNGIAAYRSRKAFPVELSTFAAQLNGDGVDLTWDITMESNNHGFELQRSFDGGTMWEVFGFVPGRGTTSEPKRYAYSDDVTNTHRSVGSVRYRLRQIDNDGSQSLSPVVDVFMSGAASAVALYQNYPNPFNPATTISYQLSEPGHVTLTVYNALGEQVGLLINDYKSAGSQQVGMSAENLPSGTYIYTLSGNGQTVQKKMTVMK